MEERGRKGILKDNFTQQGPTCGVYSLAYALDKLGFDDQLDHDTLMVWAKKVSFADSYGHQDINNGCNPIALTRLALEIAHRNAQLYADIEILKALTKETRLVQCLDDLNKMANKYLGTHYIKADYDYRHLEDGQICIGIFVPDCVELSEVKEFFLNQFALNPAGLHYMMIQRQGTKYYVYDSNVGPNVSHAIKDGRVLMTSSYTYSGLAIVLS